jgi:hypothetical protein
MPATGTSAGQKKTRAARRAPQTPESRRPIPFFGRVAEGKTASFPKKRLTTSAKGPNTSLPEGRS